MELITVPELAAILRVSPATARALLRGGLPHVRLGRQYRIRPEKPRVKVLNGLDKCPV